MNDPDAVGTHERPGKLCDDTIRPFGAEARDSLEALAEVFSLEIFHRDERNSVPDPMLEHVDHVRAAKLRGRPRLAFAAHAELGGIRLPDVDELDSAEAVERKIVG